MNSMMESSRKKKTEQTKQKSSICRTEIDSYEVFCSPKNPIKLNKNVLQQSERNEKWKTMSDKAKRTKSNQGKAQHSRLHTNYKQVADVILAVD